ncbi:hypothetical protein BC830DRAFT_1078130 [Chytriomyces sp. MP71]|nr:hypothetical protein BC830DRAFT_1078130 [Chytriomyces sp. MP71]
MVSDKDNDRGVDPVDESIRASRLKRLVQLRMRWSSWNISMNETGIPSDEDCGKHDNSGARTELAATESKIRYFKFGEMGLEDMAGIGCFNRRVQHFRHIRSASASAVIAMNITSSSTVTSSEGEHAAFGLGDFWERQGGGGVGDGDSRSLLF